jgi:prolyl 4-hydroxylase
VTLNPDPLVRSLPGFLPPAVCRLFIERAAGRLGRALVYDSLKREETTHRTRTNTAATFGLGDTDVVQLLAQARMAGACGLPPANMEAISVLHYDVGEEITNHYDFVDPRTPGHDQEIARLGQRVVTFLVYLNADYEGGETAFPKLDLRHRGGVGDGLYFVNALPDGTADLRTMHAGCPPATGEKWIISQFIRDRSLRPGGPSSRPVRV